MLPLQTDRRFDDPEHRNLQFVHYLMKLFSSLTLVVVFTFEAVAQVTVTGTVADRNGNRYVNGTASAYPVNATGSSFLSASRVPTTSVGFFSMSIPANTYPFTLCTARNSFGLPIGDISVAKRTPQQICFGSSPIAVAGGFEDISTELSTSAKILGPNTLQVHVNGVLDVRTFGAVGDGVTDDSAAVQAAVNQAFSNGGIVYFPNTQTSGPTTYLMSTVTWKGVSLEGPSCGGLSGFSLSGLGGCLILKGKPGEDIMDSLNPTDVGFVEPLRAPSVKNLTFLVNDSTDVSATLGANRFLGRPAYDGVCTSGSTKITSNNARFVPGDTGHAIMLYGCGPGGSNLLTTIASVVNIPGNPYPSIVAATAPSTSVNLAHIYISINRSATETAGNCAISVPIKDGAINVSNDPGFLHARFENVIFTSVSASTSSTSQHHSCGIYTNGFPYSTRFDKVQFSRLWLGYGDAPPQTNPTVLDWASDANSWTDMKFDGNTYAFVEYDSTMSHAARWDMYESGLAASFYLLGFQAAARSSSQGWTIESFYNEPNSNPSGQNVWITGLDHVIIGGSLKADSNADYVQFDASDSFVSSQIGNDGTNVALKLTGNGNQFFLHGGVVSNFLSDIGTGNSVCLTRTDNIFPSFGRNFCLDTPRLPVGMIDSSSVFAGNATHPYNNTQDLLITPHDMQNAGGDSIRSVVADPTAPLTHAYYSAPSPGSVTIGSRNGVGGGSYLVGGTTVPLSTVRIYIAGKASAGCSANWSIFDINTQALSGKWVRLTWTTGYSVQYFDVNLSTFPPGHEIGFQASSCGTSSFNLGWLAIRPWPVDPQMPAGASLALSTYSIDAKSCAAVQTASMTGLTSSMAIVWSFASTPIGVSGYGTGGLTITTFPTANTANVVVCNITSSAIAPGTMTLNLRAIM